MISDDYEEIITSKRFEFSFVKSFKNVENNLIEEEINESNKNLIKSFTESLKMMKSELESRPGGKETLKEILNRIKYSLVESVYIRQSLYLRFILKEIFKIEYKCSDIEIIEMIIDAYSMPQIFKQENYFDSKMSLEEILEFPLKLKNEGDLFENYKTSYPFDRIKAKEELEFLVNSSGKILLYENFFIWFSNYIQSYKKTLEVLMNEEGIIPITWRYYIAIMAVSSIRSYYMLKHLQESFLIRGGDEDWLIYGLSKVPEKLQKLSRLNNILAHQPWKITTQEINELLINSKSGWTRDELVHASLILVNYHRLCSIIESLKYTFIENFNPMQNSVEIRNSNEVKDGKTKLYNNLVELNEEENLEEKEKKSIRKFSGDDLKIVYNFEHENTFSDMFNKHTSNFCTLYLDFDVYSDISLHNMNFSWDNEGFYILQNIFQNGTESIDNEIKFITELSSFTIGGDFKKLDTFHFRNSIKSYIEKIFGVVNDEYDYRKTNLLLLKSTKAFVKNVACLPQKISKMDIPVLYNTFSSEEIFHLIFVVSTTKQRAQLTFLTHRIYEIIKSID